MQKKNTALLANFVAYLKIQQKNPCFNRNKTAHEFSKKKSKYFKNEA